MIEERRILNIIDESPYSFYHQIKSEDEEFHSFVKGEYSGGTFSEKLYIHLNEKKERFCNLKDCEGECEFYNFSDGFGKYCSRECKDEGRKVKNRKKKVCPICGEEFEVLNCEGDQKTCSLECRNEWLSRDEVVKERIRKTEETLKKKYGDETYRNVEKAKETKREKYGDPNYNNVEKMLETKRERYGEDFGLGENARKTIKEKYGHEQISKTEYYRKKRRKTEFKKFYNKLINSDRLSDKIEPLFSFDDYEGVRYYKTYPFKCKTCGEDFEDHMMGGHVPRCTNCYPKKEYTSKGEKEVYEYISKIVDCEVVKNDKSLLENKELDLYIPDKNVAVEFNGLYWHSEVYGEKDERYHLNKTQECEERGIQLIHIFEDEWIERKEVVKNRLKNLLNVSDGSVYARNCNIVKLSNDDKDEFFEKYHLQGTIKNDIVCYGLVLNDELVSSMSFGNSRYEEDSWEIYRFCNSDVRVVGGASKLFSRFVKTKGPEKVVSYADRRWSMKNNTFYSELGFDFEGVTDPSYWYMKNYRHREYRFNYRKNKLKEKLEDFDTNLTEWENMQLNGYDRIWDCGNLKFVWKND